MIVGGGAGGLELAARLGRAMGPRRVVLVDMNESHIWKPSLHEVAAGTLDIHREDLSYFMLARDCGFTFMQGELKAVDRSARRLQLAAVRARDGEEVFPERVLHYSVLVLAVGSRSNFFGVPGAAEHAITVDSTAQAEHLRQRLLRQFVRWKQDKAGSLPAVEPGNAAVADKLHITIVGGGATGVELAAELLEALAALVYYGLPGDDLMRDIHITLIEASGRILAALPPELSAAAQRLLQDRGVEVLDSVGIAKVDVNELVDRSGNCYPYDLCVWAAGIEAPAFLASLGLETNRIHQIVVDAHLRTSDAHVYAMGDCAQMTPVDSEKPLPARAQVAHQQAFYLYRQLMAPARREARPRPAFYFRDYGSLVSIGHSRGVGALVGILSGRSWLVQGLIARLMYMSLHLTHHAVVLGPTRTLLLALGRLLLKRTAPRVKLH